MSSEQGTQKVYVKRSLHKPDEEIAQKPRLKAKPVGSRQEDADEARPGLPGGALFAEEGTAPQAPVVQASEEEAPKPPTKLPRIEPKQEPSPYATHRSPPKDKEEEKAQLAALTGRKAGRREVSAGFLLGIALIVVVLIGGIMLARMQKQVRRLDARIGLLEQERAQTAEAPALR